MTQGVKVKVVAVHLDSYLGDNDLKEHCLVSMQGRSEYTNSTDLCSCDTLHAIDDGHCAILILLDLSAPFNTIDHSILLGRLGDYYGIIKGKMLAWLRSYLSDRSQFVYDDNERSSSRGLTCSVPQGLLLGPMLY